MASQVVVITKKNVKTSAEPSRKLSKVRFSWATKLASIYWSLNNWTPLEALFIGLTLIVDLFSFCSDWVFCQRKSSTLWKIHFLSRGLITDLLSDFSRHLGPTALKLFFLWSSLVADSQRLSSNIWSRYEVWLHENCSLSARF